MIAALENLVDEGIVRHASVGRTLLNSVNRTVQERVESVISGKSGIGHSQYQGQTQGDWERH